MSVIDSARARFRSARCAFTNLDSGANLYLAITTFLQASLIRVIQCSCTEKTSAHCDILRIRGAENVCIHIRQLRKIMTRVRLAALFLLTAILPLAHAQTFRVLHQFNVEGNPRSLRDQLFLTATAISLAQLPSRVLSSKSIAPEKNQPFSISMAGASESFQRHPHDR